MSEKVLVSASVGIGVGFGCWFMLGFMGLPKVLIYVSGIWVVEPILRFMGLYGQVNLLLPALVVCLVMFTIYGITIGAIAEIMSERG